MSTIPSEYINLLKNNCVPYTKIVNGEGDTIVNIFTSNSIDLPTPERNKIQNSFLDPTFVDKFVLYYYGIDTNELDKMYEDEVYKKIFGMEKFENLGGCTVMFEHDGWDVYFTTGQSSGVCSCSTEDLKLQYDECLKIKKPRMIILDKYDPGYESNYLSIKGHISELEEMYIIIKPTVGDEYPCILQSMVSKIEPMRKIAIQEREKSNGNMDNTRWYFCLLIGEYNGIGATRGQLVEIFKQHCIKVIFMDAITYTPENYLLKQLQYHQQQQVVIQEQLDKVKLGKRSYEE